METFLAHKLRKRIYHLLIEQCDEVITKSSHFAISLMNKLILYSIQPLIFNFF